MEFVDERRIIIFSCGYNCEKYVERCITSVKNQDYFNYVHVIVDDASTDRTLKRAIQHGGRKTRILGTDENQKWIKNAIRFLDDNIESPDDIIITLDLDDSLNHEMVLSDINKYYNQHDVWMTYSNFIYLKSGRTSNWIPPYTQEIITNRLFRESIWSFTHLRTFKAFLWDKLDKNDLKDSNGEYFKCTYDMAVFFPMLEMSRNNHIGYIPELQYIYNDMNPLNVDKSNLRNEQQANDKYIRSKRKYGAI